jgi:hypothetical protein
MSNNLRKYPKTKARKFYGFSSTSLQIQGHIQGHARFV